MVKLETRSVTLQFYVIGAELEIKGNTFQQDAINNF